MKTISKLNVKGTEEKLMNTIFNYSEPICDNIKKCNKSDLLEKIENKTHPVIFDSLKENPSLFPSILRRISENYFPSKNFRFTVYPPGVNIQESLNVKNILEECEYYFFLIGCDKPDLNFKSRDVLIAQSIIDKIEIPIIYKVITEDSFLKINKNINNVFKITSENTNSSFLIPSQYIKKEGFKDRINKNTKKRILICAQVF